MSGYTMEAAALFGFASCDDLSGRVRCGKISSFQSGQLICWYLLSIHSCTNLSSVLIRGLDGYGWIVMKTDCACQLDLSGYVVKVPLMFWDSWDKIIWCFSPRTDSEFMDVTLIFPTWTCEKECATFRYPFHRFYRGRFLHLGCTAKLQFWWVAWSFLLFFGLLHHEVLWVVAWALAQFQAPQSGQLIDLGSPGSAWSGSSPCLDLFSR